MLTSRCFHYRSATFKVVKMNREVGSWTVRIVPWPRLPAASPSEIPSPLSPLTPFVNFDVSPRNQAAIPPNQSMASLLSALTAQSGDVSSSFSVRKSEQNNLIFGNAMNTNASVASNSNKTRAEVATGLGPKDLQYDNMYFNEPMWISLDKLELIEANRGKAGALNVFLDYLRLRANKWASNQELALPIQTFAGIVDARHMLAEPTVFWNESLPFFARNELGVSAKDFGESMDCMLVQFPQFFSNVKSDDYLDNKNSGYYTIWQTLRDCAKCVTSSGTNAVWDVTDSNFYVATTSRIEDTGTSQKYLAKYLTVHLPCFVAYGIAKNTEDYIEAVYRWSTGAVELFWASVFSDKFTDYALIFGLLVIFGIVCFVPDNSILFLWVFVLIGITASAYVEKSNNSRPLRRLIVSTTIVMNTAYWFSNLFSLVWVVLVPLEIGRYDFYYPQ